jgi:hypothetical protein
MRRLVVIGMVMCTTTFLVGEVLAGTSGAATLNVCPSGCAYSQLAAAVADARSGDTIRVGPGTYLGGFSVLVSVSVLGAGAGATVISGGGPVITIGSFGATTEPTVSIEGVTITNGWTRSSAQSPVLADRAGVWALGGGMEIPPGSNFRRGATVVVTNSVITGNRATPSALSDGTGYGGGGGLDNWGTLTLVNTTISDNRVGGGIASHALGAGLLNWQTATLTNTTVRGNRAVTTGSNACNGNAAGGGILSYSTLTITGGVVADNLASLSMSNTSEGCGQAEAGGIFVHGGSASVIGTTVWGNAARATNDAGDANAYAGGIGVDGADSLTLRDSTVIGNAATASVTAASANAGVAAGGVGVAFPSTARITDSSISQNAVSARAVSGTALAEGGGIQTGSSVLSGSIVNDNRIDAVSVSGSAIVHGAGIQHGNGALQVIGSAIHRNVGAASGFDGEALGGGVWNDVFFPPPPIPRLALVETAIQGNRLSASAGIDVQGGGVYTAFPVAIDNSVISDNLPGDCFGLAC